MMEETFEAIARGQWFRYGTAVVEIGLAALLWVPGMQVVGAGLLCITMICGALFHVFVIGPCAGFGVVVRNRCRDQPRSMERHHLSTHQI